MNTQDTISTKICTKCQKDLPLDQYYIFKRKPNKKKPTTAVSYYPRCKKCHYEVNMPNVKRCLKKKYNEDPEFRQLAIEQGKESMKKRCGTKEGRHNHNEYVKDYYRQHRDEILRQRKERTEKRNQRMNDLEAFYKNFHEMLASLDLETRQKVLRAMQQPASTK